MNLFRITWSALGAPRLLSRRSQQRLWRFLSVRLILVFHGLPDKVRYMIVVLIKFIPGDLFIDGKVIHRPQYRYNERQQTRTRPRPRYDRRRETMQADRRGPMRRDWAPSSDPMPMDGRSPLDGQLGESAPQTHGQTREDGVGNVGQGDRNPV